DTGQVVQNGGTFQFTGGNVTGVLRVDGTRLDVASTVSQASTVHVVGDNNFLVANNSTNVTLWVEGTLNWGFARLYAEGTAINRGILHLETTSNDSADRGTYLNANAAGTSFVNETTGRIEA